MACTVIRKDGYEQAYIYQKETDKPYDDVLSELQIAISENNFRVLGHSRVGKVIRDRDNIDFPDYDTIQFCNLSYAKSILLISPHAIRYMPCNAIIYKYQDKTVVMVHLLPDKTADNEFNKFANFINKQLKQIVDFAADQ